MYFRFYTNCHSEETRRQSTLTLFFFSFKKFKLVITLFQNEITGLSLCFLNRSRAIWEKKNAINSLEILSKKVVLLHFVRIAALRCFSKNFPRKENYSRYSVYKVIKTHISNLNPGFASRYSENCFHHKPILLIRLSYPSIVFFLALSFFIFKMGVLIIIAWYRKEHQPGLF